MVNNALTYSELEKILLPIIKLEDIEKIKMSIYEVLHFTKALPVDKNQYFVCSETTGVNSTYRNFSIGVKKLEDIKNDYSGVIIQFEKIQSFFDCFVNPINKLVDDLQRICSTQFVDFKLIPFEPGGTAPSENKEQFIYLTGSLNPNWKKDDNLSPFTIYTRQGKGSLFVELLFAPRCYQIQSGKTALKSKWLEAYTSYIY